MNNTVRHNTTYEKTKQFDSAKKEELESVPVQTDPNEETTIHKTSQVIQEGEKAASMVNVTKVRDSLQSGEFENTSEKDLEEPTQILDED